MPPTSPTQGPAVFASLGSTADEVADSLRLLAIRGVPNTVRSLNPVVRYAMSLITDDVVMLDVIRHGVLTVTHAGWRQDTIPLSPAVVEFLEKFNGGDYPDLILSNGSRPG
jgi:hypothetical protein